MTDFIGGNQIELLRCGAEYFPALEAAIAKAESDIYLQTYIYKADAVGVRIGDALKQAAQRGVSVHLLLDGFGCKDLPKLYIQELKQAGIQVLIYRQKISPWTFKKNRLSRLHRKVVVIDSKIGFVGGINIIDDYDAPGTHEDNAQPRIDYAVCIEGALMPEIVASVHKLWRRAAWRKLLQLKMPVDRAKSNQIKPKSPPQPSVKVKVKAAYVLRDNILHRRDIENAYLKAINHAQSEIIIANAYFVPGLRFRQALRAAARRGVNVKLLLQGRLEYLLMFATHTFYREFLKNGIEIYEYRKSFMHSKVAVIDSHWATVGSSNIDPFSLLLAREANVIVLDHAFSSELRSEIIASINEGAYRITAEEWTSGNWLKRVISWLVYGLVRAFLGVIGRANEH